MSSGRCFGGLLVFCLAACGGGDPGPAVPDGAPGGGPDATRSADAAAKTCGSAIVDLTDPATGCATASCEPCPLPTGAVATRCASSGACDYTCPPELHEVASGGCGPAALGIAASQAPTTNDFTCAITTDHDVRCWGRLESEQLGMPLWNSLVPKTVAGLANVEQLAAGGSHMCAIVTDGSVWCWGRNDDGQLGDGSTTSSIAPVAVVGLPAAARAISAGTAHACAALVDGDVWCWGSNRNFVLGRTTTDVYGNPPGPIAYTAPDVTALASSRWHNCGLTTTGHVLCWGDNRSGELGTGATSTASTPVEVVGLSDAVAIAAGGIASSVTIDGTPSSGGYSFAVRANGTVLGWGYQNLQLGLGTGIARVPTPTPLPGLGNVAEVAVGQDHVCATTRAGTAMCRGNGSYGKLGAAGLAATNHLLRVPTAMPDFGTDLAHLAAGRNHTCMVADTELRCLGDNGAGQLGDGTQGSSSSVPVRVAW